MQFNRITPSDPVTATQINNLQDALEQSPDSSGPEVFRVNGGNYNVKATDRYIVVDARGGPVRLVLPLPKVKQELTVKNGWTTRNAVTIVRIDGNPFGNGNVSVVASADASGDATDLLCDATQWWPL